MATHIITPEQLVIRRPEDLNFTMGETEDLLKSGYLVAVSGEDYELAYWSVSDTYQKVEELWDCRKDNQYLGCWVDDDQIYFDYVVHIPLIEDALILGYSTSQLAIWDCANEEEIRL